MELLTLLALALAPGAAIATYIYWRDEHEKEPLRLMRKSFLFGLISILITSVLSLVVYPMIGLGLEDSPLETLRYHPMRMLLFAVVGVGFVEELSKWIMVRSKIYSWVNFNEPYDGIFYSVMVSLGFATLENIGYVFGAEAISPEAGLLTGFLRMFTAVPAHAVNGILMGYFIGKAKFEDKNKDLNMALSILTPTLLHGAYDYFAFLDWIPGIIAGAIVALIIGVVLSLKAIKIHQDNSPFKNMKPATTIDDSEQTTSSELS
ncbi:MAG: PrsW family intramembrane metalloprotease [Candidatus Kapaibacterium sp.]